MSQNDTPTSSTNTHADRDFVAGNKILGDQFNITGNLQQTIVQGLVIKDIEQLPPEAGIAPYRGLQYFDEEHAEWFFGREKLTAALIHRLYDTNFLAVVGDSGSGKSSVVRAGVIPALKRTMPLVDGSVPPLGDWQVRVLTPTARPLEKLAATLFPEDIGQQAAVRGRLETHPHTLREATPSDPARPVLLVIDQFEELFSQCKDETQREAFIANVVAAARPTCKIVLTLRADFYAPCLRYEPLRRILKEGQEPLGPMSREELTAAILAPSAKENWQFQLGLVEEMLEDVGQEPGALPLLSHALRETWERRRGRVLTLSGYREAGGVKKAIAKTAEGVYGQLSADEQQLAQHIFMELTELNENLPAKDSSRPLALADLGLYPAAVPLVERLIHDRLLIKSNQELYIAHEALIREWPRLRDWLAYNRATLIMRRALARAAQDWQAHQRGADYLYRGVQLRQLKEGLAYLTMPLGLLETQFLQASVARERVLRWQKGGIAVVASLMLMIVGYVYLIRPTMWRMQAIALTKLISIPTMTIAVCPPQINGNRVVCSPTSKQSRSLIVPAFSMEKYEVSNAQYTLCVQTGVCSLPLITTEYDQVAYQSFPVRYISGRQASAYCQWIGRQLPTEVQWEVAVGQDFAPSEFINPLVLSPVQEVVHQSSFGIFNLVGNVVEWTRSYQFIHKEEYEEVLWNEQNEPNLHLILRGGSFLDDGNFMRISYDAHDQNSSFGFRCVVSEID